MKNFRVTVNGTAYDVTVDETDGLSSPAAPAPSPAPAASAAPAAPSPAPAAAAPAKAPEGALVVKSPMPGVILDVCVKEGDTVTKNQVVVMLEAMKMENEIVTPSEGKIAAVHVTPGKIVITGDPLVSVI